MPPRRSLRRAGTITNAGPTEYQASDTTTQSRSGWALRHAMSGNSPSTEPRPTSAGTQAAGMRKTIGTNTSWVGRISPGPN